jgi:competence protein ComGC
MAARACHSVPRRSEDGFGLLGLLMAMFVVIVFVAVTIPQLRDDAGETVLDQNLRSLVSQVTTALLDHDAGSTSISLQPSTDESLSSSLEHLLLEEAADDQAVYENPYVDAPANTTILNADAIDLTAGSAPPAVLITKSETCGYNDLGKQPRDLVRKSLGGTLIVHFSESETDLTLYFVTNEGSVSKALFHLSASPSAES